MFNVGDKVQQYTALALLLLVLYFLGVALNTVMNMKVEAKQEYDTAIMQLSKYQSVAEQLPSYEAENKVLITQLTNDKRIYVAQTTSLVTAEFQKDLQNLVEQSGVDLISIQVEKIQNKDKEEYIPITAKLQLRVNNGGLTRLIHSLESQQAVGVIDALKVQSRIVQESSSLQSNSYNILLDVSIKYTAFIVKPL